MILEDDRYHPLNAKPLRREIEKDSNNWAVDLRCHGGCSSSVMPHIKIQSSQ